MADARGATAPEDFGGGGSTLVRRAWWLALATGLLVLVFVRPLIELVQLSFANELYSHVPLIPFISLYLVWQMRRELTLDSGPSLRPALLPLAGGVLLVGAFWIGVAAGWQPAQVDYLSLMTLAFLLFVFGASLGLLGAATLRTLAFPAAFLIFMVPFPQAVEAGIEIFFQYTSAEVSYWLLKLTNIPVFRQGLIFILPGISLEVARECSGIRSSLVLFITSLLAGHMFLRNGWSRTALVLAVIPLGIARNAVRIVTLSHLCVHVGPEMIHSALHRRGGPIFFLLSLVPLFVLLVFLRWSERRKAGGDETSQS